MDEVSTFYGMHYGITSQVYMLSRIRIQYWYMNFEQPSDILSSARVVLFVLLYTWKNELSDTFYNFVCEEDQFCLLRGLLKAFFPQPGKNFVEFPLYATKSISEFSDKYYGI